MNEFKGAQDVSTFTDVLVRQVRGKARYDRNTHVAPAVILWPDKNEQWKTILPQLRHVMPELLVLGEYDDEDRRIGPAIWIRCMIARKLAEADWPEELTPIIYLPGVSRQELRSVESCLEYLQPLAELQFRGEFWSQQNGKDWTVLAFLKTSSGGLGLDVAEDNATKEAIQRSLSELILAPVASLQGKKLEAPDFDELLGGDYNRDILLWLDDPEVAQGSWTEEKWAAFCSRCKGDYSFDPVADGRLAGAELLCGGKHNWDEVWSRFEEAPRNYPKIPDLLREAAPPYETFFDKSPSNPRFNQGQEDELRLALQKLEGRPVHDVREKITGFDEEHGERRLWVWAKLGESPLAMALEPLNELADATKTAMAGSSVDEICTRMTTDGYIADAAALKALNCIRQDKDSEAVKTAVRALYHDWLDESALRLQDIVRDSGYAYEARPIPASDGICLLFADGLRFDLAVSLVELLEKRELQVELDSTLAALPSVTETCKPAVSPVVDKITGTTEEDNFKTVIAADNKPLSQGNFKRLLADEGWQFLEKDETGDVLGKAWTEYGSIDKKGHSEGWKLAWRIDEELAGLVDRITSLAEAGWQSIQLVTDHGWLLMPGGLPKADIPRFLTETRWGRCARLRETSIYDGLIDPWTWNEDVQVATPRGISNFYANSEYSHGGISLQECVIPLVTITTRTTLLKSELQEPEWVGLRCRVEVLNSQVGFRVDLRTKLNDPESSVAGKGKELDDQGKASLLVEDDTLEGDAVHLVLLDAEGSAIAKYPTTIGG